MDSMVSSRVAHGDPSEGRPQSKAIWRQSGFSLLELVVTLGIISATLVAIVPLFRQGIRAESSYENATTALTIAQKKMESLRATDYVNLQSQAQAADSVFPTYTAQVTVTDTQPLLKDVQVTVRWTATDGIAQTYQLSSLRTEH